MEYEIRFYYSKEEKDNLISILDKIDSLSCEGRVYEKTIQYNSTLKGNDFYSESIDGRYRVRLTKGENFSKCLLSWKRRLNDTNKNLINKEEEIECRINSEDYENFIYLTENVVKLKRVESYERYRTSYFNDNIEISIDEYPFGIALELEAKSDVNQEKIIDRYMKLLDLKYENSYRLSWDDKYEELCLEQGIDKKQDVLFSDENMPVIR